MLTRTDQISRVVLASAVQKERIDRDKNQELNYVPGNQGGYNLNPRTEKNKLDVYLVVIYDIVGYTLG